MIENLLVAEHVQERGSFGEVVDADFLCAGRPLGFDSRIEVVALVQEVDIFGREVGEQERLAAVLRDVDNLVQDFVGPGTQVGREDNLFRAGECGEGVARFLVFVEETDLLHRALHVGLLDDNQVFEGGMDFLAVVLERELDLVEAQVARGDHRADAQLGKARLAGGFFRGDGLGRKHLVVFQQRDFDFDVFAAAVVEQRELEVDFALRSDHVFQFADEHAARRGDFAGELLEALAFAVLVADAAEVGAVVGPLVEEEAGDLRVALESGNLVKLALGRDGAEVLVKVFERGPDGLAAFAQEGLDGLVEVLDFLLALDAARTVDVGRLVREQGVVLERDQQLVLDVGREVFFAFLEVRVAEAGVRDVEFVVFLVEAVGEVMRVGGTRVQARVDAQRGVLENPVVRDGQELAGILVEGAFVVEVDTVEVADGRAAHVERANHVQELVAVLEHEGAVLGAEDPYGDTRMVLLFLDDIVDEFLRDFEALRGRAHRVEREFLEHQEADAVADVQSVGAERSAAAADGVESRRLHGAEVLFELGVVGGPEAAFAPLLVVADTLDLEDLVVQVVVALEAVKLAEAERLDDGEGVLGGLALVALDFELELDGEQVGLVRAPHALVLFPVLDAEDHLGRCVFAVELERLVAFVHVAARALHEDAQAGLETARVVERRLDGDPFLVHVRFEVHIGNECRVTEDEVHVAVDTAEGVLVPREANRHFARVGVTVVGAFAAFATEVDAAVGGTHVGHAHAENVFFANLERLLGFQDEGGVGAKVRSQELTVEPNGGVGRNALETQENAFGDQLFVVQGEPLEVVCAILGHQELAERAFPDVGDSNGFGVFGVCRIPAIGDAGIFSVPFHLPVAVKAHDLVHSGVLLWKI